MINKNLFIETKNRLIKMFIIVIGSFLLIFSFFVFRFFTSNMYSSLDKQLNNEFNYLVSQINNSSFFDPIKLEDPRDMVYVYKNSKIRYYTSNEYFNGVFPNIKNEKVNDYFKYNYNGHSFRVLDLYNGKYKIQVIRNIDSELNARKQLIFTLLIGAVVSLVITYLLAIYLTKKALVPIENVWENQSKFIQDASHELRTPITIINSKAESMLKNPNNTVNDEVEKIASVMKESRKIKKLINNLLSLSKEDAVINLEIEEFDLVKFIEEIYRYYVDIAQIQSKKLNFYSDFKELVIKTDMEKFRNCILIFVDNAFKYTKSDDSINLKVVKTKKCDGVSVVISDTGFGIKEDEIPYIFNRFFRSSNVRNLDIEGSGIGLSIADLFIKNLSMKIEVDSKLEEGTSFEIMIPFEEK